MLIFLDASAMDLVMQDTAIRTKLRRILAQGNKLVTSSTVAGEMQQLMMERGKEAHFLYVEMMHALEISIFPPKAGLKEKWEEVDAVIGSAAGAQVSVPDRLHLSLAALWKVDIFVTNRAQAHQLKAIPGVAGLVKVVDVDTLFKELMAAH